MNKIISFEDVCCSRVCDCVLEMTSELEEEAVAIDFTYQQLNGLLHQFYQLYQQKGIAYSYFEDMQSYFATIYTDIIDYNINSVSFSTIMDGFFHCYGLMSPVDINRNDFRKTMKQVYRNNWVKGGRNHAR